jgi:hypothetical protein
LQEYRVVRRLVVTAAAIGATIGLAACSSGGGYQSDYVSPIAATPAPPPMVPVAGAPAGAQRRMPLLPPVPEARDGLPPVNMALSREP